MECPLLLSVHRYDVPWGYAPCRGHVFSVQFKLLLHPFLLTGPLARACLANPIKGFPPLSPCSILKRPRLLFFSAFSEFFLFRAPTHPPPLSVSLSVRRQSSFAVWFFSPTVSGCQDIVAVGHSISIDPSRLSFFFWTFPFTTRPRRNFWNPNAVMCNNL